MYLPSSKVLGVVDVFGSRVVSETVVVAVVGGGGGGGGGVAFIEIPGDANVKTLDDGVLWLCCANRKWTLFTLLDHFGCVLWSFGSGGTCGVGIAPRQGGGSMGVCGFG